MSPSFQSKILELFMNWYQCKCYHPAYLSHARSSCIAWDMGNLELEVKVIKVKFGVLICRIKCPLAPKVASCCSGAIHHWKCSNLSQFMQIYMSKWICWGDCSMLYTYILKFCPFYPICVLWRGYWMCGLWYLPLLCLESRTWKGYFWFHTTKT